MTPPDTNDDRHYMSLAIEEALKGVREGQTPFGACIVRNGRVIAADHNQVWQNTDITAHAEIVTLRNACRAENSIDLSNAVIYSTTEPCPMCFAAIHWARITRIVYGASIQDAADHGFHEIHLSNQQIKQIGNLQLDITPGVMRERCLGCFKEWAKRTDHQPY